MLTGVAESAVIGVPHPTSRRRYGRRGRRAGAALDENTLRAAPSALAKYSRRSASCS
jgi:hypothetical protein